MFRLAISIGTILCCQSKESSGQLYYYGKRKEEEKKNLETPIRARNQLIYKTNIFWTFSSFLLFFLLFDIFYTLATTYPASNIS